MRSNYLKNTAPEFHFISESIENIKLPGGGEKEPEGVSRRHFLKKAGKILGGALLVAGSMYETEDKSLRELEGKRQFDWGKLEHEIQTIKREFREHSDEEIRRRVAEGIEKYAKSAERHFSESKPVRGLRGLIPVPLPRGFIEGMLAGLMKKYLDNLSTGEGMTFTTDQINKILLFGAGGAAGAPFLERIHEALQEEDEKKRKEKWHHAVEEAALRVLDYKDEIKYSRNEKVITWRNILSRKITEEIEGNRKFIRGEVGLKSHLAEWGAGSYLLFSLVFGREIPEHD